MPVSESKRPALGHRVKRWLYIIHRWIGIGSCLLFAIWFLSGLVMIYVPFPALTSMERLSGLEAIDWRRVSVQPRAALAAADVTAPKTIALELRDGTPVWRIDPWEGPQRTIPAGRTPVGPVDAAMAQRVAERFGNAPVRTVEPIERDQWTVAGGYDRHRPLWKAELDDPDGTVLYIASSSGAVVLDTRRQERFWNWVGSVPHWIYPTVLRQDNAVWRQVVMWVAGPCIAVALTGMWIGILRMRIGRRRFKGGRITPYHGRMWWHHIAGLSGGMFLLAWIFSGWLSVDPGRFFASAGLSQSARIAFAGATAPPPLAIDRLARMAAGAKRLELRWIAGQPSLAIERVGMPATYLDATTLMPIQTSERTILMAAGQLVPGARILQVERLNAPDLYWYEVGGLPLLPVLRVKYDDPARTWLHIDPATGAILGELDHHRRLYRWMFDLLHKWDLNGLTLHRPAWDTFLWLLSSLGLITSVSGIWIGGARLMRPKGLRHRAPDLVRDAVADLPLVESRPAINRPYRS